MIDPRLGIINKRLENVKRIIAVSGGKWGIGKSSIASITALCLSKKGYKVGLLDLDFSGPSSHVILGIEGVYPEEKKGIVPPEVYGIRFMSIIYFAGNNPSPLRGNDVSNAIVELLAITLWDSLDVLIMDMPPGIGDAILDVIRLIKRMEFLIVTTQSKVATEVMKKEVKMLKELGIPIVGVLENMRIRELSSVEKEIEHFKIPMLGAIDFDTTFEDTIGDVDKILESGFAKQLQKIVYNQFT
jgi:ATP-binding protein involved in chromosome partitioning